MIDEELLCGECGDIIEEGDEVTLEDGTVLCRSCFEERYFTCDLCDTLHPIDEMEHWGDSCICRECLEEQCPSFDEEQNDIETQEAYDAFRAKYIGREAIGEVRGKSIRLDWNIDSSYSLTVEVNEDGIITHISRLYGEQLLWESDTSSEFRPIAIEYDDYQDIAEDMIGEILADPDEDD